MNPRTLTFTAVAAGTLYALTGAIELGHDQPEEFAGTLDYLIEACFVAALALSVVVLWRLRRTARGRAGTGAFVAAAAGNAVVGMAALATLVSGGEALDAVFPLGVLLTLGGYGVLVVLDLRGRLGVPRSGVVLAVSFLLAAFLDEPTGNAGGLLLGAGWYALARLIQPHEETLAVVESPPWSDPESISPPA
jgi:hypothetical protein